MSVGAVAAAIGLLVANGFFVAAEFALLAARRSRVEQLAAEGSRQAGYALAGLKELSVMMAGAQLGITMASLGLGAVAEPAIHHGLEALLQTTAVPDEVATAVSFALALAIVVFLHMVVGEMAPKSWAIADPERSALRLAGPFRLFVLVLRPFIVLLNMLANGVVRLCGVTPQAELATAHSPTDLRLLLKESAEAGHLALEHQDLLSRAIDLSGLDAESAMVPRVDVVAVDTKTGIDELERIASASGRSRLPVYDGDLDRIRGVLHVKDLLAVDDRAGVTAETLARPALLTPESRPLEHLMVDMRHARQHIAVVVDEHGTVTGLVALEDLLEEIIGDFEDESDRRRSLIRRRPDGTVLVPGTFRPDELADTVEMELPEGDYETVAGFVIAELGRLPNAGDEVAVDSGSIRVVRMDGHRVVEVAVKAAPASPEDGDPPQS